MSSQVLVPANLALSHKFSGLHLSGHLAMIRVVKSDALDDLCLLIAEGWVTAACLVRQAVPPSLRAFLWERILRSSSHQGRPLKGMNTRLLRGTSTLARASVWQLQCQVIQLERNEDLPGVDFCSGHVCYDCGSEPLTSQNTTNSVDMGGR